jgi:hypothetical protein
MTDPELLSAAITASGLSVTAFCRDILVRNSRTVWRWLNGDSPIPLVVLERCRIILTPPP